ncbi:MAG TPA: hypothetical protein VHC49_08340 [Mycobacteriales bacterium]|nr:hypothetical protein [Mycobacteriales bacterium]
MRSVDSDFGFARWEDAAGEPVDFPSRPSVEWLQRHQWQWQGGKLDELLHASRNRSLAVCGAAYNMADHLGKFDLLILLRIDESTMIRRLTDPSRNNDWGKVGATLDWSRELRRRQEAALTGAEPVDARQPLGSVVDDVLRIIRAHGIDLSPAD